MTSVPVTSPTPSTTGQSTRQGTDIAETAARLRLSATRLARILRQQSDAHLTPTQISALATLQRCGPIPVGALAEAEQIAAPTATKVVDKLHEAGLVERVGDPTDRRVTLVSTTPLADDLLGEVRARKTAWLATRLAELPPTDLDRIVHALDVLEHLTTPRERAHDED